MSKQNAKTTPAATPDVGPFPISALKDGCAAKRAGWRDDYMVRVGMAGGRTHPVETFMLYGQRSGPVPWVNMTPEDILADDWIVNEAAPEPTQEPKE